MADTYLDIVRANNAAALDEVRARTSPAASAAALLADAVFVGETAVDKVMLGADQIWPALPLSTGLDLPGTSGNYVSVPDSAALDITGDLSIMADVALDDWTPAVDASFVAKQATGQFSYRLRVINGSFVLRLTISADGTATTNVTSSTAPVVADGGYLCVGCTWRASDGRTQFWTAPTGTTTAPGGVGWTQLGTDQIGNIGSIHSGSAPVEVGAVNLGTAFQMAGVLKRARVWASIDGTDERLDLNFVGVPVEGTRDPATILDAAEGATATVNGTGWDWATP